MSTYVPEIWTAERVRSVLPPRRPDSHKGTYGSVLAAAGSPGMMGAAVFACRGAYASGAGLVRAVIPREGSTALTVAVPEAVQLLYGSEEELETLALPASTAALVGPGLGKNRALFHRILDGLETAVPLVIDADGLNLLAEEGSLDRPGVILTPHVGEAARLVGCTTAEIMKDVPGAALALARKYRAVVALKCWRTMIASPSGRLAENHTGNPGMSTGGSGDVLAGLIAGLAGGYPHPAPEEREETLYRIASAGVWLHGAAGDAAAAKKGIYALVASDIADALRPDLLTELPALQKAGSLPVQLL